MSQAASDNHFWHRNVGNYWLGRQLSPGQPQASFKIKSLLLFVCEIVVRFGVYFETQTLETIWREDTVYYYYYYLSNIHIRSNITNTRVLPALKMFETEDSFLR